MNTFRALSNYPVGGPICEIIAFSTMQDIFPTFLLISKDFSSQQVEFSLKNIRTKKEMNRLEDNFLVEIVKGLYDGKKKLNETLFIKLLEIGILNPGCWFSHPYVNDSVSLILMFWNFGYKRIVDYCVENFEKEYKEISKDNYFLNSVGYCSRYSTVECLEWFFGFFSLKEKIVENKFWRNFALRSSIEGGKIENFRFLLKELRMEGEEELWCVPSDLMKNLIRMKKCGCSNQRAYETFVEIFRMYKETKGNFDDDDEDVLTMCVICVEIGLLEIVDYLFDEKNELYKDVKKGIHGLGKLLTKSKFVNQTSIDHLFRKYGSHLKGCYSDHELIECCFFGQIDIIRRMDPASLEMITSPPLPQNPFLLACERGYANIVSLFLEKYDNLIETSVITKGFLAAGKFGYLDIIELLIEDGRIDFEELCSPDSNDDNILMKIVGRGHFDDIHLLIKNNRLDLSESYKLYNYRFLVDMHDNEELVGAAEEERCKIITYLMNLTKKNKKLYYDLVDPSRNDNQVVLKSLEKDNFMICKLLIEDERVDPSSGDSLLFLQSCQYYEKEIFERFLNDPRVDPSERNSKCLFTLLKSRNYKGIVMVLKDGRVDPTVNFEEFPRKLSCQYVRSGDLKYYKEIFEMLANNELVNLNIENDFVLEMLFSSNHKLGIIKYLISGVGKYVLEGELFENCLIRVIRNKSEDLLEFLVGKKINLTDFVIDKDDVLQPWDWKGIEEKMMEMYPEIDFKKKKLRKKIRQ